MLCVCFILFPVLFSSFRCAGFRLVFRGPTFARYFHEVHNKSTEWEKEGEREKRNTDLRCTHNWNAVKVFRQHTNTHTYFLSKWNLLLLDTFSVAPYHFNGNYNLIASFNIIMGHRQHVNGISIICTTYRIEENTRAKERGGNGGLKCKLRLFGLLMGWQWQSKSLSLCWNWRWRQCCGGITRTHTHTGTQKERAHFIYIF